MTLIELGCLRIWTKTLFVFMSRYQHDLERMRKECRERFGSTQSGNCPHCGKYIQQNLGKHVALYHIELAQLWRCPVAWSTVWKGTAQDCIDHMRQTHDVHLAVKAANLARYFPPWTVAVEQWSAMTHVSISGVAIIVQPHWVSVVSPDHQSSRNSCGFPGDVHAMVTCISGGVGFSSGTSATSPMRQRTCGTDVAVIRSGLRGQNGPQSVVGLSPGPDYLVSKRGGGRFFQAVGIGWSASVGGVHCTSFDGFGASSLCGIGRRSSVGTVSSDSPASPAACHLDISGQEDLRFSKDPVPVSSSCLNLDELSSLSDDDTRGSVGLSDFSITLLCDSDEVFTPVNSDQVLSDIDLP